MNSASVSVAYNPNQENVFRSVKILDSYSCS